MRISIHKQINWIAAFLPASAATILAYTEYRQQPGHLAFLATQLISYALFISLTIGACNRCLLPRLKKPWAFFGGAFLSTAASLYALALSFVFASQPLGTIFHDARTFGLLFLTPFILMLFTLLVSLPFYLLYSLALGWLFSYLYAKRDYLPEPK